VVAGSIGNPSARIRIEAASIVHGIVIVCKIGIPDAVVRPGREDLEVHRQKGIAQPGMTKQKNGDRLVDQAARLTKGGATRRRNS
jgi:hypothetical protein